MAAFVISTLIFYSFIPNYNAALEKYFGFKETQLTMVAALSMVLAAVLIYFIIKAALDTVFEKDEITQSRGLLSDKCGRDPGTADADHRKSSAG